MSERNLRKTRVGKVVSDKMDKTVVVAIEDNVNTHFTRRLLKTLLSLRLMMRTTPVASATEFLLWKLAHYLRIKDGAL